MSLGLFGDFLRNLRLLCGFSFLMIAAGATRFALVLTLGPIALFPGILRTETVAHALDHFGVAFSLVLSLTIAIKAIVRSEEHTSELQSLIRISYVVFCLITKKTVLQSRL